MGSRDGRYGIQQIDDPTRGRRRARAGLRGAAFVVALLLALPGTAWSALVELRDHGAFADIFIPESDTGPPEGIVIVDWGLFGESQVNQFIFLSDDASEIDPLPLPLVFENAVDTNSFFDDSDDAASILLGEPELHFEVGFLLRGVDPELDPGLSDLAETIMVVNETSFPVWLNQIVETGLLDGPDGDSGVFPDEAAESTFRVRVEDGESVFEEVVTPEAVFEAIEDTTFLLQWQIDPGETLLISKDKRIDIVPEPGTAALLGLGLLGLTIQGRRRPRAR